MVLAHLITGLCLVPITRFSEKRVARWRKAMRVFAQMVSEPSVVFAAIFARRAFQVMGHASRDGAMQVVAKPSVREQTVLS